MVFSERLRRVPGQNSIVFPATNSPTDEPSQKDTFDVLYDEGLAGEAKIMTVILHPHIIGRGGRLAYFEEFLEYSAFLAGFLDDRLKLIGRENSHRQARSMDSAPGRNCCSLGKAIPIRSQEGVWSDETSSLLK